jgi:hypothetical protein
MVVTDTGAGDELLGVGDPVGAPASSEQEALPRSTPAATASATSFLTEEHLPATRTPLSLEGRSGWDLVAVV